MVKTAAYHVKKIGRTREDTKPGEERWKELHL